MSSSGELNSETKARVDLAFDLDCESRSDLIMLSGWAYRPDCSIAIADAMKRYISGQVPSATGKLVCQRLSRDTVGDAVFARLWFNELFSNETTLELNVVTSDYHTKRTQEIFDFVFAPCSSISVKGAAGFGDKVSETREIQSLEEFRRTFSGVPAGDLKSIYWTLRKNHPFYNGMIYPRIGDIRTTSSEIKKQLQYS